MLLFQIYKKMFACLKFMLDYRNRYEIKLLNQNVQLVEKLFG